MSALKKTPSFKSKIPIRKTKPEASSIEHCDGFRLGGALEEKDRTTQNPGEAQKTFTANVDNNEQLVEPYGIFVVPIDSNHALNYRAPFVQHDRYRRPTGRDPEANLRTTASLFYSDRRMNVDRSPQRSSSFRINNSGSLNAMTSRSNQNYVYPEPKRSLNDYNFDRHCSNITKTKSSDNVPLREQQRLSSVPRRNKPTFVMYEEDRSPDVYDHQQLEPYAISGPLPVPPPKPIRHEVPVPQVKKESSPEIKYRAPKYNLFHSTPKKVPSILENKNDLVKRNSIVMQDEFEVPAAVKLEFRRSFYNQDAVTCTPQKQSVGGGQIVTSKVTRPVALDTDYSSIGGTSCCSDMDATSSGDESIESEILEIPIFNSNFNMLQQNDDALSLDAILGASGVNGKFSCESLDGLANSSDEKHKENIVITVENNVKCIEDVSHNNKEIVNNENETVKYENCIQSEEDYIEGNITCTEDVQYENLDQNIVASNKNSDQVNSEVYKNSCNLYETIHKYKSKSGNECMYETINNSEVSNKSKTNNGDLDLKYSDNKLSDIYYIKVKPKNNDDNSNSTGSRTIKSSDRNISAGAHLSNALSNNSLRKNDESHEKKTLVETCGSHETSDVTMNQETRMMCTHPFSSTLADSCGSLDCPPPPSPPSTRRGPMGRSPETRKDPQAKLVRYLRALYREWGISEAPLPPWAPPVAPGVLCPAHYQPELRLAAPSPGAPENINVDQLLTSIKTRDGTIVDPPRRVLVVAPPGLGRSALSLRILHAWSTEPRWPPRGSPVSLAVFVPLAELKGSLEHFVSKVISELLPKISPSPSFLSGSSGGFSHAWSTLGALGGRLLFLLDGYDLYCGNQKPGQCGDVVDLLEGRLFPEARVIVTSSQSYSAALAPLMHRRVTLEGLSWLRIEHLLGGHYPHIGAILKQRSLLSNLAREPLGWLALSVLHEELGSYPEDELQFVESMLKCLLSRSLASKMDGYIHHSAFADMRVMADFGRLALTCIKQDRLVFHDSEIREYCKGRGVDATDLGFLNRAILYTRSQRKKMAYLYTPVCRYFIHLLAAYYLVSIVHYSTVLKMELDNLLNGKIEEDALKVLQFTMGLLGWKGYLILKQLCPLTITPKIAFELVKSAGESDANISALCEIVGAKNQIQNVLTSTSAIQIRTNTTELEGWSMILRSPSCALRSMEIVFQQDKYVPDFETFLDSLNRNDSLINIKITSLIEHDVTDEEIHQLTKCLTSSLTKPRLKSLEIILTFLEDAPPLKFQPLVNALCSSLPRQVSLNKLVLDLNLTSHQLSQICAVLEGVISVTHLHLPHLCCDKGTVSALATLLTSRPLTGLSLAGSWSGREDPPSSSGVSMGSGSGSSSGVSGHLIKQSSLTTGGNPSPKTNTYFSSLPRGIMPPIGSLNRSATLPRQPIQTFLDNITLGIGGYHHGVIGNGDAKRNSDSVISRHFYPVPMCDVTAHTQTGGGGLHDLFVAARDPACHLQNLNVSKCQMSLEDSMCLGETVRFSHCLDSLRMEGATRLSEVLPSVLAVAENRTLKLLDLASPRIVLEDGHLQLVFQSFAKNTSLRLLGLEGWTFRIENPLSLLAFPHFLERTSVCDLVLTNCRLHLALHDASRPSWSRHDVTPAAMLSAIAPYRCDSVVFLRLGGCQVTVNDHLTLTGPLFLPFLRGFRCLRDLDLSVDRNSIGTFSTPLVIDDKTLITFFQTLATNFKLLQTLHICNWKIMLEDGEKTFKMISKSLKSLGLSHLKMSGISIFDRTKKYPMEHLFIVNLITNLSELCWLGLGGLNWGPHQGAVIGESVRERFQASLLDFVITDAQNEGTKEMIRSISLSGRLKVKISNIGSNGSCTVRVTKSDEGKSKSIKRRTSMKN